MSLNDNWRRSYPTTQLGTAEMEFFVVDMGFDIQTNASDKNSAYSRAIRGLQSKAELYLIGQPSGNLFTVVARTGSVSDARPGAITGTSTSLSNAVAEACGDEFVINASINNPGTNVDVGDVFRFSHPDLATPIQVRVTGASGGHATTISLENPGEWTNPDVLPPTSTTAAGFTRTQIAAGIDYNAAGFQVNLNSWGLAGVNVFYASIVGGNLVWND